MPRQRRMPRNFGPDFYIFCTPKDDPDANSYIKIIDPESPFMGVVFVINWIKVVRKLWGGYKLKYDYTIIEPPEDTAVKTDDPTFKHFVGDIIVDIWEKHYA